jgi:hypothetical protein
MIAGVGGTATHTSTNAQPAISGSTANAGDNAVSQNVPPALILNKIVKL